jgi:hypothetical protein
VVGDEVEGENIVTITGKLALVVSAVGSGGRGDSNGQSGVPLTGGAELGNIGKGNGADLDSVSMLGRGCGNGAGSVDIAVVGGNVLMPVASGAEDE